MTKEEQISAASYALMKGYDFETLLYCDVMYGKSEFIDDVWDYVIEAEEIGSIAFKEKYKEFKMYNF